MSFCCDAKIKTQNFSNCPQAYDSQFSRIKPSTRLNSRKLRVTKVSPKAKAWPASIKSYGPIEQPFDSKIARTFTVFMAASASKGKI